MLRKKSKRTYAKRMKPYTLLLLGLLLASAAEAQTTDEARLEVTVTDAASGEALGYAVCSLRPKEGNGKERAAAADARGVCLLEGLKPGRFELRLLYMGHVFLQGELQLPAGLTRRRIRLDIDRPPGISSMRSAMLDGWMWAMASRPIFDDDVGPLDSAAVTSTSPMATGSMSSRIRRRE